MKHLTTLSSFAFAIGLAASNSAFANPLVAAGGGGGAPYGVTAPGGDGQTSTAGQIGINYSVDFQGNDGAGGVAGSGGGGGADATFNGGGGAGWDSNGGNGLGVPPLPPQAGTSGGGGISRPTFAGGQGGGDTASQFADGGFGGGGGGGWQGGGGGGGYSGGGGGDGNNGSGGGGGSYIAPSGKLVSLMGGVNGIDNSSGQPGNDGYVIINGTRFDYTGTIIDYTTPARGIYDIEAVGAQGGGGEAGDGFAVGLGITSDRGGFGALAEGEFFLNVGTVLEIIVGGAGLTGDFGSGWAGGGGGGSFVCQLGFEVPGRPSMIVGHDGCAQGQEDLSVADADPPGPTAVPEPTSLSLLTGGLLLIAGLLSFGGVPGRRVGFSSAARSAHRQNYGLQAERISSETADRGPGDTMTDVVRARSLTKKQAWVCLLVLACASVWNARPALAQVTETVLHSFTSPKDARSPLAAVIVGKGGEVYGNTAYGGSTACGGNCGTVFKLTPPPAGQTAWTESLLWNFTGGPDGGGANPGITAFDDNNSATRGLGGLPISVAATVVEPSSD